MLHAVFRDTNQTDLRFNHDRNNESCHHRDMVQSEALIWRCDKMDIFLVTTSHYSTQQATVDHLTFSRRVVCRTGHLAWPDNGSGVVRSLLPRRHRVSTAGHLGATAPSPLHP